MNAKVWSEFAAAILAFIGIALTLWTVIQLLNNQLTLPVVGWQLVAIASLLASLCVRVTE